MYTGFKSLFKTKAGPGLNTCKRKPEHFQWFMTKTKEVMMANQSKGKY